MPGWARPQEVLPVLGAWDSSPGTPPLLSLESLPPWCRTTTRRLPPGPKKTDKMRRKGISQKHQMPPGKRVTGTYKLTPTRYDLLFNEVLKGHV